MPNNEIHTGMPDAELTQTHLALQEQIQHLRRRSEILLSLPAIEEEAEDERIFMQRALEAMEELTDSQIGFIHFMNEDQETIELVTWSRNTIENYCTAAYDNHYPISQAGIWADAARQGETVVINDYANAPNKRGLPAGHSHLQRLVSVPVLADGEVRMILGVGNKPEDYDEQDVETLELIGGETWRLVNRRRMTQALHIASQVVNASPVVCFRWRAEADWPVEFVSDNVTQWGYDKEAVETGQIAFSQMIHPDDLARVIDEVNGYTANGLTTYLQEYRVKTCTGQIIWVEDRTFVRRAPDGRVLYYDGIVTDMTERKTRQESMAQALAEQKRLNKRLEEAHNQLLQSEKMASIGQLAAGIAHELNNPIGFVHSNMGTLESYLHDLMDIIDTADHCLQAPGLPADTRDSFVRLTQERDLAYLRDDVFQLVAESKDGLTRVRKIVQDLKSFSRVGEQDWQEADLHQGLDSTLNIVWNELKYKCTIKKEYGELPKVFCLISQLNQVFMNLLVNAGQAIETQGEITIRTACRGQHEVCIEIADSGKGIAPEHLNRIFEPFFTTKPVGKGTGLGLSVSYSIIERHHGRIEVDSTLGQGTTFRVILPINHADIPPPSHE